MSWMEKLYETYEKSKEWAGVEDSRQCTLLPIGHSTQNAQIEIVIDLKGDFQSARVVEKAEAVTIIPVTEDSASRSSGIAPHPLFDKLCYTAGDYCTYFQKKGIEDYHKAYLELLEKWIKFDCHDYVKAIYVYIKKNSLIKDLITTGILKLNERGILSENVKIEAVAQADGFVRFRIQDENVPGTGEVWKQKDVYEDYINFYQSQLSEPKLDYITGEMIPCSEKQPSKIRNSGDKAKLISANDASGFTYRGRFTTREEALLLGYVTSQKAHNALKWLIERQGYRRFGMCVVAWNPEGAEIPDFLSSDTADLVYMSEPTVVNVGENYSLELKKALLGNYSVFEKPGNEISVIALDAATPGRLSIRYYRQMLNSEFLERIVNWHETTTWKMSYKKNFKNVIIAPTPEDIVRAAYGIEQKEWLSVDDKLMKDVLERLIPCVIDGKRLPLDIVRATVENASRPMAFNNYNRRKILEIACALIHKKYEDQGRKEFDIMSLDRSRRSRDYLYGRLLAIAHKLEYDTFSDDEKGKRETNATRFTSMLVKNPTKIWGEIDKRINPYRRKLKIESQVKYQKEFQEVYDLFDEDDFKLRRKLGEEYLLGYNCELSQLWSGVSKEKSGGNENE